MFTAVCALLFGYALFAAVWAAFNVDHVGLSAWFVAAAMTCLALVLAATRYVIRRPKLRWLLPCIACLPGGDGRLPRELDPTSLGAGLEPSSARKYRPLLGVEAVPIGSSALVDSAESAFGPAVLEDPAGKRVGVHRPLLGDRVDQ